MHIYTDIHIHMHSDIGIHMNTHTHAHIESLPSLLRLTKNLHFLNLSSFSTHKVNIHKVKMVFFFALYHYLMQCTNKFENYVSMLISI